MSTRKHESICLEKRLIILLLALALLLSGCGAEPEETPTEEAPADQAPVEEPPAAEPSETESEEQDMKLLIGDTEVPVTWEENASVDALRALLPLTIRMSMYGGFEQVGPIGKKIAREDKHTTTGHGDIVLYSGDQIVIFYGSNSWSYTRLGHVDLSQEEMEELLSNGDVTITIRED